MFININPMTNAKALISIAKPVMFIRTIKITYNIPNAIEIIQALRGISRVFFFFLFTAVSFVGLGCKIFGGFLLSFRQNERKIYVSVLLS